MIIKQNDLVLFQGDSITDCSRVYEKPHNMGTGYAMMTAAWFQSMVPQMNVQFINRGISGNRAADLKARWQKDCIDLNPNVVSILIGVNDTWRRYDKNDPTSVEKFKDNYRFLLTEIQEKLDAKIIMCEPFLLQVPNKRQWREDLDPKIDVVRELAREFQAILIPFDGIFASVSTKQPPAFWAGDGVHPSSAGHALMARSWLEAVGAI